ncbi:MAG: prenyltransferase/squalene oxidase repeat-containing protein [Actinomycetota bacterium]|nr:prenyltransferase/squalene oxidase repeat-containing protein [Actinomycetota bacterium]
MSEKALVAATFILAGIAAVFLLAAPLSAGAAQGVSYIRDHQSGDGGFAEPGAGTSGSDATTAWSLMALSTAGVNPRDVRKNGKSPVDFLSTQSGNWKSVTDYERTLLAVTAAEANPRSFGGVDLVARVQSYERSGGRIGDAINSNAFGVLAYVSAGVGVPPGAVQWQKDVQNADGGWGNDPGGASNPDMTAASVMALRAAGVGAEDASIKRAFDYLRSVQNDDGGFSFQPGASDVAATSWCVMAIVACGQDPGGGGWSKGGNTPRAFLVSMQAPDGHFYWVAGRDMNPVWTTSYAVCALAGKPFPVKIASAPPEDQPDDAGEEQPAEDQDPGKVADETDTSQVEEVAEEEVSGDTETQGEEESGREPVEEELEKEPEEALSLGKRDSGARTGGDEDDTGGSGFPWWLIPILAAPILLGLGGWLLSRRYAMG